MTLEEVEAVFGEPGENVEFGPMIGIAGGRLVLKKHRWGSDGLTVEVWFGPGNRFDESNNRGYGACFVVYQDGTEGGTIDPPADQPPTISERFRHWLRERLREDLLPTDPVPFDPEAA